MDGSKWRCIVGVISSCPPVMVFRFIGASLLTLAVAIPIAEMCSMYPVAGRQYSWVAAPTPPRFARGLSYATGWFILVSALTESWEGLNNLYWLESVSAEKLLQAMAI